MSTQKIRWGILGAAKIAQQKVIPAMQKGLHCEVAAIASRDLQKSQQAAQTLNIPKAYGSYEELLADKTIDAIYNPLPNHLHVPWTIKCLQAGKHVLCEKPLAQHAREVRQLIKVRDRYQLKVGEAFMVLLHPQWQKVLQLLRSGVIGDVRLVEMIFSYSNLDPNNIRNKADVAGGAMMDIGCYPIFLSRHIYNAEPLKVTAVMEFDPTFKTDRLSSAVLRFPQGHAIFTVSTQAVPYQRIQILGTKKRIEVEIPVNAPPDQPSRIIVHDGQFSGQAPEIYTFEACDQYTLQANAFSQAILNNTEVPVPLEDTLKNTAAINAIFKSTKSGKREKPE